ncbi:MAG: DUF1844 domain-containing protein [Deltaproteobacteria bacterium]|nr:DUF1844 domain-containing protein [Deltaproteobacteria bacterium]
MADNKQAPQLDFNAFVLSLGTSALVHLGEIPDPGSDQKGKVDLPLAQQSIDLLALLQDKTRGNLTKDEQGFLEKMLYELRVRYVETARKK